MTPSRGPSADSPTRYPLRVTNAPLAHMCAVCRQPLSLVQRWDTENVKTEEWLHAEPADHEAQPVPRLDMDENLLQPVCDFCGTASPLATSWLYPVAAFAIQAASDTRTYEGVDDGEGWGACAKCHDLIEKDARDLLAARTAAIMSRRSGQQFDEVLEMVRPIQALFFTNRTGPAIPAREYLGPDR